jgi:hypothetical protein
MFGIKKLQSDLNIIKLILSDFQSESNLNQADIMVHIQDIINEQLKQKLDLSKINTRFHDLGEKHEKSHEIL